jgi:hypothetical protein
VVFEPHNTVNLTEALVSKNYSGDAKGTSTTKWLMAYAPDKTALYVGIERIKVTATARWCCCTTAITLDLDRLDTATAEGSRQ